LLLCTLSDVAAEVVVVAVVNIAAAAMFFAMQLASGVLPAVVIFVVFVSTAVAFLVVVDLVGLVQLVVHHHWLAVSVIILLVW
jgi:hypothetical protein